MFLVYLSIYVIIVLWLLKHRSEKLIINDVFWLLVMWSFTIGLYFFSGIHYKVKMRFETFLYVLLCLAIYILTRYFSIKGKRTFVIGKNKGENVELNIWFAIGVIAFIVYSVDLFTHNTITWGVKTHVTLGLVGKIANYIIPIFMPIWLFELGDSLLREEKVSVIGWFSLILYCLQIVYTSGRINIVMIMMCSAIEIMYIVKKKQLFYNSQMKKIMKSLKKIISILLVGVLLYFIFLSDTRYGNQMLEMFEYASGCRIDNSTARLLNKTGIFSLILLNGMYYFSHQLSKLEIIISTYKGPYLMGGFQFNFFSKAIAFVSEIEGKSYSDSIYKMFKQYDLVGLSSGWDTIIGASIYDFGRIGTIIFISLLGWLAGKSVKKFKKDDMNITRIVIQSMICSAMFMTLELGPFYNRSWPFAMIWSCIISKFPIKLKERE